MLREIDPQDISSEDAQLIKSGRATIVYALRSVATGRGRKFMSEAERAEVSRRMSAYWAKRRKQRAKAND